MEILPLSTSIANNAISMAISTEILKMNLEAMAQTGIQLADIINSTSVNVQI